jgi:formylglycine-generating enzyme required for sulfatase activity
MKKYALLVGVEEYEPGSGLSPLKYAGNDALAVGRVLRESCGFDTVRVLADRDGQGLPTSGNILNELEAASLHLGEDDLFFFLFAGHGIEEKLDNSCRSYLMPRNANLKWGDGLLEMSRFRKSLSAIRSRQRLILLDCCRNDPEAGKGDRDNLMGSNLSRDLVLASTREGGDRKVTILMTACRSGQRAYEWDTEKHGVFSFYLKEGLSGAAWENGILDARRLCAHVEERLAAWSRQTGKEQLPDFQQLESAGGITLAVRAGEKAVAIPTGLATAPRLVVCPLCGRRNEEVNTFRCQTCGKDHFCLTHQDPENYLCPICASRKGPGSVQAGHQNELLQKLLEFLNKTRTRATYGAVAGVIGVIPQAVGQLLGEKRPEASWVVNQATGMPTGYKEEEISPELSGSRIINHADALKDALSEWSIITKQPESRIEIVESKIIEPAEPKPGETWTEPFTGMDFVYVPGGSFEMGDTFGDGSDSEKPVHRVTVPSFWLGKYPVTQGEWEKVMGSNPSEFKKGLRYPVEKVSWNDCQELIGKLNGKNSNGTYRLPSESEWEYAARSGGKQEKWSGTSNKKFVGEYAWYSDNCSSSTEEIGRKKANGLGLYDMGGNVCEWCQDKWHDNYQGAPTDGSACESGDSSPRVFRGGSWFNRPRGCRSACRRGRDPGIRYDYLGLRLAWSGHQ